MQDPWFWMWMGPFLAVCFAALFACGVALAWLMANPPWKR